MAKVKRTLNDLQKATSELVYTNQYLRNYSQLPIIEMLDEIKHLVNNKVSDRWLNINEVCDYSGLSDSTIYRVVRRGILKASTSTGKLLFKISSVDRWLSNG